MKILITGYKGYIGSALALFLKGKGLQVWGIDSNPIDILSLEGIPQLLGGYESLSESDLGSFSGIIHLAAASKDDPQSGDLDHLSEEDEIATLIFARKAAQAGIQHFIFASSSAVYGKGSNDFLNENSHLAPLTQYAETKLSIEKALLKLKSSNFSPVILRLTTLFGYSPVLRKDLAVNNFTLSALATGTIKLHSDGQAWRTFIHINDLCEVYFLILNLSAPKTGGQIYDVGNPATICTINELAKIVQGTVSNCKISHINSPIHDPRNFKIQSKKLFLTFGNLNMKLNLETGIKDLIAQYTKTGLSDKKKENVRN